MPALHEPAPEFALSGVFDSAVKALRLSDLRGGWAVLFFYPADFSFVCPTEIRGFEAKRAELARLGCRLAAISSDSVESHRAWAEELGGVGFPLLSDPGGETARVYGVRNPADGRAYRATFILDPEGKIAYSMVSPANVGRSVAETLRVLQALQTGRLCPVDWKPGDPTMES
ncbi:MAG: peroxiredoxin [Planctomycetes bacterium]|nr:peroxiredoxin [Planctomycetota bacterium]